MSEVPKIVHLRLQATTPEQIALLHVHPEPDVLAAFAEGTLMAGEREGVLQHLALCADCREVAMLALPAMDVAVLVEEEEVAAAVSSSTAGQETRGHKSRFAWATLSWAHLRWATLAAGIAIAVFVMRPALEHVGKTKAPPNAVVGQLPTAVKSLATPEIASNALPKGSEAAVATVNKHAGLANQVAKNPTLLPKTEDRALDLRAHDAGSAAELARSEGQTTGETVAISGAQQSIQQSTQVSTESSEISNEVAHLQPAPVAPLGNAPDITKAKPPIDETASDQARNKARTPALPAVAVQTSVSPSSHDSIGKDKDSRDMLTMSSGAVPLFAKRTTVWMIADGVLKRSLDSSHNWEQSGPANRGLLCYASSGEEVWAGGQAGALLHSIDNGTSWSPVAVAYSGQPLTSSVTHIDVSVPALVVLSTDSNETWTSGDSGKTWKKK